MSKPSVPCAKHVEYGQAVPSAVVYRGARLCAECAIAETALHFQGLPKATREKATYGVGERRKDGTECRIPIWMYGLQPAMVTFGVESAEITLYACFVGDDGRSYNDESGSCVVTVTGRDLKKKILKMFNSL